MKDLKLYIEVVFYADGTSERLVIREYVNWRDDRKYDTLARFKNNFLGKIRAKRKLAKWKKYHEAHDFSGEDDYSVIEEIIFQTTVQE